MYHAWLQPTAPHWTHAAAAVLQGSPSLKGASGRIPVNKSDRTWGGKRVILSLNPPEHCLKPCLLTSPDSTTSHVTISPVFDHTLDLIPLLSTNLFQSFIIILFQSTIIASNAPSLAHANPDAFLCLHGLQDSQETASVGAHLEQHLCWKAWQCTPGTCSGSKC